MHIKVTIKNGEIIAVEVALPTDATSVNTEKVADMMRNPDIAEACAILCPAAPFCVTLAQFKATLDDVAEQN